MAGCRCCLVLCPVPPPAAVKLPTLLAHANVDERGSAHLAHCLQDILRFMAVREEKLFPIDAYIGHSAEYQKRNA